MGLFVYVWILKTFMLLLKENTTLCHWYMYSVDVITTTCSCSGATLFSTLDAEKAFYQIC